jgi:uncharacterized protein (DUF1015 family)
MPTIRPFRALRPAPELATRVCELPYDVLSTEEARAVASDNPLSFFHVSKPEIDLPADTDPHSPQVYERGRENFDRLIREGALKQDGDAAFYLYRQIMGEHVQTGLVATASCEDYLAGTIRRHEFTRPDKEDDRVHHMEALSAQTGPVFLTFRADAGFDAVVAKRTASPPEVDFTASDGVRHSSWALDGEGEREAVESVFERTSAFYIADGHHRTAAAARVYQARRGAGSSAWFLSVIVPHDQVRILPYNRAIKDLNGLAPDELVRRLSVVFDVAEDGEAEPSERHRLGLYLDGEWRTLRFRPELTASGDAFETLDVTLLQQHVLAPILGIDDPRTSDRIRFVGGIRGTAELERLVDSGDYACAFSMHPTGIEDLMSISDAGGVMPPKSTWFEPKLRDGMFCHLID